MQSWIFSCWKLEDDGCWRNWWKRNDGNTGGCYLSSWLHQFSILQFIDKDFCLKTYKGKRWICFFFCSYKAFRAFFFTFFLFFYCSRFVSFFFWKYWIYFQLLYWITSIILVFFFKISRDYFSLFNIALLYRSKFYKNGYFEFLLNLQR